MRSVCKSTFSKRANLNKHVRKFHPVSATETSSSTEIEVNKSPEARTSEADWDKDPEIELDYDDTNSDGQSVSSDSEEDAWNKETEVDLTLGRIQRKRTEPAKVLAPKRRNASTDGVGTKKAKVDSKEMNELRVSVIDVRDTGVQTTASYRCDPCGIIFDDEILSTLHRGWHSHSDAFLCNLCGENCGNKHQFHSHMAKSHDR